MKTGMSEKPIDEFRGDLILGVWAGLFQGDYAELYRLGRFELDFWAIFRLVIISLLTDFAYGLRWLELTMTRKPHE